MIEKIKKVLWQEPNGIVWKITDKYAINNRKERFNLFMDVIKPGSDDTVLDVGVCPFSGRAINFFELLYPYRKNVTALTNDNLVNYKEFRNNFPEVTLIFGDARKLEFPDNYFDIVFSNAVVEHVGKLENQKKFIEEITRVSRKAFVATPNYYFPIDSHTLIPFAHYLPVNIRCWIYEKLGRGYFADINTLNLLTPKSFISLFPKECKIRLYRQKSFGLTTNLIALAEKY